MKEKRSPKKQPRDGFLKVRNGSGKIRFQYSDAKGRRLILRKGRHGKAKRSFRYFTEEQYQRHLARR